MAYLFNAQHGYVDGKEIVRTIVIVRLPPRVRDETAKKFTRDK